MFNLKNYKKNRRDKYGTHRRSGARDKKGMALLIAVIATSALLLASIAISDISFKQQLISYSGRESKIAFYAADAGLECALYYDLKVDDFFNTPNTNPLAARSLECNGIPATVHNITTAQGADPFISRFSYNLPSGLCVIVEIEKITSGSNILTQVTSRGYNTSCSSHGVVPIISIGARNVERALEVNY